jgi:hypothetical protein
MQDAAVRPYYICTATDTSGCVSLTQLLLLKEGRYAYLGHGLQNIRDKDDPMFAFVGNLITHYMAPQPDGTISIGHGGFDRHAARDTKSPFLPFGQLLFAYLTTLIAIQAT